MANKLSSKQIVDYLMQDLRTYPLDFPLGRWGDKFIELACKSFWGAGRKNSNIAFLKELEKRLSEHPAPTVHGEFAVDWIIGHVYQKIGNTKDW